MRFWKYIYYLLLLTLLGIGIAIYQLPDNNLHVIACDVGQGDAILVTYKDIQILTDGGPDKKVIDCLGRHVPFWDRQIELVISTHPDADHSTGLIEVVKRYKAGKILINPIDSGTQVVKVLQNWVKDRGIAVVSPTGGTKVVVGLISLDIVNPTVSQISSLVDKASKSPLNFFKPTEDTNDYSISYKLSFGRFTALFTGDFGPKVSDRLADGNQIGNVDYIKVPHHGSKNGLTQNLLEKIASSNTVGVISVGTKNRYGHPTQEILDLLTKYNVKTFRTDEMGDVEVITDGEKYWIEK